MKRSLRALILLTILAIGIYSNYCVDDRTAFINIYESLKEKLTTVKGNNFVFSFDSLKKGDVWNWNKSNKVYAVDSSFYLRYLSKYHEFTNYKNQLYFYCIIDIKDNLKHIVILLKLNSDISDMYLANFTNEGKILNVFLLARISKSPDDVFLIQSELINRDSLKTIEIHVEKKDDTFTKDSIISLFKYEKGSFNKVNVDTINISNFKW